jgi:hypothetical protein
MDWKSRIHRGHRVARGKSWHGFTDFREWILGLETEDREILDSKRAIRTVA